MPPLIQLLRPHQWVKNGFVLIGLLFGHAWANPDMRAQALAAFVAFCLISSAVYVMNDIIDHDADRRHPEKRKRPLASGKLSVRTAVGLAVLCLITGLGLAFGLFGLPASQAPWIFVVYVLMNIGYSMGLKHVVILDVFIIAAGFMLRILAGTLGLGIAPSHWLVLCSLMLTLFLGFAKRRAELDRLAGDAGQHRAVLESYTLAFLDRAIFVCVIGMVVTYALYTVAEQTVALHGTEALIWTLPWVLLGSFRYLFRLHYRGGGGDPTLELLRDPLIAAAALGWVTTVLWIIG
jgi:4-hydroxybenzoate polyprenyltransferase